MVDEEKVIDGEVETVETEPIKKETGPWKAFAVVAKILGIISIAGCWCFLGFCGIDGIVFGILGKRSPSKAEMAKKGLKQSIIGLIISFVIFIVIMVLSVLGIIEGIEEGIIEIDMTNLL